MHSRSDDSPINGKLHAFGTALIAALSSIMSIMRLPEVYEDENGRDDYAYIFKCDEPLTMPMGSVVYEALENPRSSEEEDEECDTMRDRDRLVPATRSELMQQIRVGISQWRVPDKRPPVGADRRRRRSKVSSRRRRNAIQCQALKSALLRILADEDALAELTNKELLDLLKSIHKDPDGDWERCGCDCLSVQDQYRLQRDEGWKPCERMNELFYKAGVSSKLQEYKNWEYKNSQLNTRIGNIASD